MNILVPGGSGQVGQILKRRFQAHGHQVVILSQNSENPTARWDGKTLGDWQQHDDESDVVINLAGRTVNCRYTETNLRQMMDCLLYTSPSPRD